MLYFSSPEVSFDAIIGVFESGNFRYLFKDVNGDDIMLWFLFLKKNCSLNDIKLSLRYLKKFYIQVRTLIDWKINSKDVRCIRENFLFLFDSLKKFQIDPFIDTISNLSLYVNWNAKKEEQMYVIMLIYSKSGSVITALLLPPPNIDEDVPSTD